MRLESQKLFSSLPFRLPRTSGEKSYLGVNKVKSNDQSDLAIP